jgi:uncharacterized protein YhaN
MAEKPRKSDSRKEKVNKTKEIKRVAEELFKNTGSRPRPREIVKELKDQKVVVTSPQVSQALSGTVLAFRQKRRARKTEVDFSDPSAAMTIASFDDVVAAREYVQKVGTLEKARAALTVLAQFRDGEANYSHVRE